MEDPQERAEGETGESTAADPAGSPVVPEQAEPSSPTEPSPPTERFSVPTSGRPRIEGVEAGVAAGLVPSTGSPEGRQVPRPGPRHLARDDAFEEPVPDAIIEGVELPDWTDPPTREVPRVLLQPGAPSGPVVSGPVWRESQSDFDQDQEAFADMVSESVPIVPHDEASDSEDDFSYENFDRFEGIDPALETVALATDALLEDATIVATVAEATSEGGGGEAQGGPAVPGRSFRPPRGVRTQPSGRNPVIATVTGLLVGAIALLCFYAGPVAVLAIASVVLFLAAAECFQAFRTAHYQPATLLGLVAAPGFAIAAYFKGPTALPIAFGIAVVAVLCWYLIGVTRRAVVANISVSLLGVAWIAVLGSFVGLLLDPTAFPLRHGLAYMLGAVEATVAYDVGGYAFGSLFGRHKMAPSLSPNKTWEGLIGGILSALVVALAVTSFMHPWDLARAAVLGVVVAFVAPVGDLAESMIKRDLHLKDMGSLLPAHGGVLDRVDALLFVLPATYIVVRLFHG